MTDDNRFHNSPPIVTDQDVRDALETLDDAEWKAEAMAQKRRLKARASAIWLALIKTSPPGNKDFKQAWVETQEPYKQASDLLGEADAQEFVIRGKMDAARLTIEVWRSQESTHRELARRPS